MHPMAHRVYPWASILWQPPPGPFHPRWVDPSLHSTVIWPRLQPLRDEDLSRAKAVPLCPRLGRLNWWVVGHHLVTQWLGDPQAFPTRLHYVNLPLPPLQPPPCLEATQKTGLRPRPLYYHPAFTQPWRPVYMLSWLWLQALKPLPHPLPFKVFWPLWAPTGPKRAFPRPFRSALPPRPTWPPFSGPTCPCLRLLQLRLRQIPKLAQ